MKKYFLPILFSITLLHSINTMQADFSDWYYEESVQSLSSWCFKGLAAFATIWGLKTIWDQKKKIKKLEDYCFFANRENIQLKDDKEKTVAEKTDSLRTQLDQKKEQLRMVQEQQKTLNAEKAHLEIKIQNLKQQLNQVVNELINSKKNNVSEFANKIAMFEGMINMLSQKNDKLIEENQKLMLDKEALIRYIEILKKETTLLIDHFDEERKAIGPFIAILTKAKMGAVFNTAAVLEKEYPSKEEWNYAMHSKMKENKQKDILTLTRKNNAMASPAEIKITLSNPTGPLPLSYDAPHEEAPFNNLD